MIYQQDWLMRQIEAMIQAVLAVALGISANEQTATQIEDSSYGKMLEKMIDDGDICAAEDLLFNDLDQSDLSWLQIALDFYSKLNNCSEEWEKTDHDEPAEYYFSNPDPYLKPQPLPPDHPRHNCYFNEDGHLCVKNLSAFWLPEFTLQKEIGGTVYTVTGSYDGVETLDKKMERIMGEKFTEKMEDSE